MKKQLLLLVAACLLWMSNLSAQTPVRNCGTMEYLEQQLKNDPAMSLRMQQIEQQTQNYLISHAANRLMALSATLSIICAKRVEKACFDLYLPGLRYSTIKPSPPAHSSNRMAAPIPSANQAVITLRPR